MRKCQTSDAHLSQAAARTEHAPTSVLFGPTSHTEMTGRGAKVEAETKSERHSRDAHLARCCCLLPQPPVWEVAGNIQLTEPKCGALPGNTSRHNLMITRDTPTGEGGEGDT